MQQLRENMVSDLISYFANTPTNSINEDEVIYIVNSHFDRYRMRSKNVL